MNQGSRSRLGVRLGIGFVSLVVHLLACATVFGQSAPPATRLQTFHVHGTIRRGYDGSTVPRVKVNFKSENISETVSTDRRGFYEADLPVGTYTMGAEPVANTLQNYERPLFRVASPTSITLDVLLDALEGCDDCAWVEPGHNSFPVPSEDGIPFQIFIRFGGRRTTEGGYVYSAAWKPISGEPSYMDRSGWSPPPGLDTPVFVAYNLFTLRADQVTYDVKARIVRAVGHVVVANPDGTTLRAESIAFRIENGEASPLHQ